MPRIYDSASDPLDFCKRCFPSEKTAEVRYGNVAFRRYKANRVPIAILNVVLGWTLWGWIGSLLWACFDKQEVL